MPEKTTAHVFLLGLILLLGVQLTGFTCPSDWQGQSAVFLAEAPTPSSSASSAVVEDGCPCHVVFQAVSRSTPDVISLFAADIVLASPWFEPPFCEFLFRPPLAL